MASTEEDGTNVYFYLSQTGDRRGPTSLAAMRALSRAKQIDGETLCWSAGMDKWTPFKEIVAARDDQTTIPIPTTTTTSKKKQSSSSSSIYVANLPPNITKSELSHYFAKCGIINRDTFTSEEKIKLYTTETGETKGDALITFLHPASVELAIQLLDETEIRPGYKIKVTEPEFSSSHTSSTSNEPSQPTQPPPQQPATKKARPADAAIVDRAIKVRKMQERLVLGWSDGDGPVKESALCIVVLKNLFDPNELAKLGKDGVTALQEDIAAGLDDCKGEIKKVTLFTKHPQGVCLIRFVDPVNAEECVRIMRGRWFDGRRIDAQLWDGVTQYAPADDADARIQDEERRMDEFAEWVEEHHQ